MTEMRDFGMLHTINDASLSVCTVFGTVAEGLVLRFVKYRQDMVTWLDSWQEVGNKSWWKRINLEGMASDSAQSLAFVVPIFLSRYLGIVSHLMYEIT